MKVSRPSTAGAGRSAGSTTFQKIRKVEQPSTRAASISSSGTAWLAYWRIMNTPKALTRNGRITAWSVVGPAELDHQHVQRDDAELGRDHHGDQDQPAAGVAAPEAQLGEGEAGQGARRAPPTGSRRPTTMTELTRPVTKLASSLSSSRSTLSPSCPPGSSGGGTSIDRVVGPGGHDEHAVEREDRQHDGDGQDERRQRAGVPDAGCVRRRRRGTPPGLRSPSLGTADAAG